MNDKQQTNDAGMDVVTWMALLGYLLAPKFGIVDLSLLCLFVGFMACARRFSLSPASVNVVRAFLLLFLLVSVSAVVNQLFTSENILKPVRNALAVILLYPLLLRGGITIRQVFDVVIVAGALNSIVVVLQFLFILQGWDDSWLRVYPPGETLGELRQPGLSSGYPSSGLLSCIAAASALFNHYYNRGRKYFYLLLLSLPGVFLSARTAVILFFIVLAGLIGWALLQRRARFLGQIGAIGALLVISMGVLAATNEQVNDAIYVMFEFIFVYLDEGTVGVRSTDDLVENHYFLPDSGVGWLIGNGKAAWGDNGIPSDVWFVQTLVGSGVIVMGIYLGVFCYLWWKSTTFASKGYRLMVFTAFAMVLISSFKASFIFSRFVGDVATLIGMCVLKDIRLARTIKTV